MTLSKNKPKLIVVTLYTMSLRWKELTANWPMKKQRFQDILGLPSMNREQEEQLLMRLLMRLLMLMCNPQSYTHLTNYSRQELLSVAPDHE